MTKNYLLIPVFFLALADIAAQGGNSFLVDQFVEPPSEIRPQTWMHPMSGNRSKPVLTKNLEAMAEVGIQNQKA